MCREICRETKHLEGRNQYPIPLFTQRTYVSRRVRNSLEGGGNDNEGDKKQKHFHNDRQFAKCYTCGKLVDTTLNCGIPCKNVSERKGNNFHTKENHFNVPIILLHIVI